MRRCTRPICVAPTNPAAQAPRPLSPASRLLHKHRRYRASCRRWLASEGARKDSIRLKGLFAGKEALGCCALSSGCCRGAATAAPGPCARPAEAPEPPPWWAATAMAWPLQLPPDRRLRTRAAQRVTESGAPMSTEFFWRLPLGTDGPQLSTDKHNRGNPHPRACLFYPSPSPRDRPKSRIPSSS